VIKYVLTALIAVLGALYIYVIPSDPHNVKMLFKVLPMLLIIVYGWLLLPSKRGIQHWLILIGLLFCTIGDYTLQWFVVGLTFFLIGHLFYIAAFLFCWKFSKWRAGSLIPLAAFVAFMAMRMTDALQTSGEDGLIIPVILYILVISTMAFTAIMTRQPWAIAGSLLFVASDSVLAWNKFIEDVAYSGPIIMITYYAAQYCIASSLPHLKRREK